MKWRFLLFVVVIAFGPAMLAVLTTGDVAMHAEGRIEERLTGALSSFAARFELEGARRRELLLRLSAHETLAQPVREAARAGTAPPAEAVARLRQAVTELFPREVPELLALATAQGAQIVITASEPRPLQPADLPLAVATLRDGQFGEVVASFDGALFRFSSAPLGVAEGAIIIGDRLGENTANRWRDAAKAQHLTLVAGGKPLVSTLPEDLRESIALAAAQPATTLQTGQLGTGIPGVPSALDAFFPLMVPGSRWRSVGHSMPGGVSVVITIGADREIGWIGRMQLFGLGLSLAGLLIGLLWVPVIYGPVQRQARSIEAHLARLRAERHARLTAKGFTKPFVSVAQELDRLADDWQKNLGSAPGLRAEKADKPANTEAVKPIQRPIDLPLAPAPEAPPETHEGTPSAFPFGDAPTPSVSIPPPVEAPPPTPKTVPAPPRPSPRLATAESLDPPEPADSGAPIPLPGNKPPPAAKPDPFAAFGPAPQPEAGDRTREAMVPEELLARSRELEQELLESPADPDEDHFREVFEEFVATRKKCGEPPDGLTLDKFTARLKKNREQLVTKYNCRSVRFQVYVKDGKAAVKAAPVR